MTDPRRRKITYPLINIVTIAICAVICGADDFVAIAEIATSPNVISVDPALGIKSIAELVAAGQLKASDITPTLMEEHLAFRGIPEPDLFIRSGGEQRLSNFLLWQLAYTELYFTDCLWPDFDAVELDAALSWFATRTRRFGALG